MIFLLLFLSAQYSAKGTVVTYALSPQSHYGHILAPPTGHFRRFGVTEILVDSECILSTLQMQVGSGQAH